MTKELFADQVLISLERNDDVSISDSDEALERIAYRFGYSRGLELALTKLSERSTGDNNGKLNQIIELLEKILASLDRPQ